MALGNKLYSLKNKHRGNESDVEAAAQINAYAEASAKQFAKEGQSPKKRSIARRAKGVINKVIGTNSTV